MTAPWVALVILPGLLTWQTASPASFEIPNRLATSWAKSDNVEFIDVREPYERHAEPSGLLAIEAPWSGLQGGGKFDEFLKRFGKRTEVLVFFCTNGMRAKLARDQAAIRGFRARYLSLLDDPR